MRFLRSGEEGLSAVLGAWSPLSAIDFDAARSKTQLIQLRNTPQFLFICKVQFTSFTIKLPVICITTLWHSSPTSPVGVIDIINIA